MRTVIAPDGSEHTIAIEWIGSRVRRAPRDLRRRVSNAGRRVSRFADGPDVGCAADAGDLLGAIVVIVVVLLLLIVGLPALFWLIEVVVVLLAAVSVWGIRVLFGRPWKVVHRGPADVVLEERLVRGWRRAHTVMVDAAEEIQRSGMAPTTFAQVPPVS